MSTVNIKTKVHTIFMLVGASTVGKTTFAKQFEERLRQFKINNGRQANVQTISSDAIRQSLTGQKMENHRHSQKMLEMSDHAFQLFFKQLELVTSFPTNAEFVILDSTGLSAKYREQVIEIAKRHHYNLECIVFDCKPIKFDFYHTKTNSIVKEHMLRLKHDVLKDLTKSKYDNIHRITSPQWSDVEVVVSDWREYEMHFINDDDYVIIGDVHGSYDELVELLTKHHSFKLKDGKLHHENPKKMIILLGDYIDKGSQVREIVELIYNNIHSFKLIRGNHENFVAKYLRGDITEIPKEAEPYFDSIKLFEADHRLQEKFLILEAFWTEDFLIYESNGEKPSFYVTHSPCRNEHIGKLSAKARRHQRAYRLDREKPRGEQLKFLQEEACFNHPLHIFGHVPVPKHMRMLNKINLDTGCVDGYSLTSLEFDSHENKPKFKWVKSNGKRKELLTELFPREYQSKKISMEQLSPRSARRVRQALRNGINFISGTMPPADKNKETGELESLESALNYYKKAGVAEVVLQPKYMGSRCNIYLHSDIEKCYSISRNGFIIDNRVDMTPVYKKLLDVGGAFEWIVLDGELLPWAALGEELIKDQFETPSVLIEHELNFLKNSNFSEELENVIENYISTDFAQKVNVYTTKELRKHYGDERYRTYNSHHNFKDEIYSLRQHEKALRVFQEQLDIYGQQGELDFKVFNILKYKQHGEDEVVLPLNAKEMCNLMGETQETCLVLDLTSDNYLKTAEDYYQARVTTQKMEGVVVKPAETVANHIVPYFKVRNADYLTLVYGYDYQFAVKHDHLFKKKNIDRKKSLAVQQYQLGLEMLNTPLDSIGLDNEEYEQKVIDMLYKIEGENVLDPRL